MTDDSNQLLNELEQAVYRGVTNLALSKNLQWMLSKKLLRAKAVSLAEKLQYLEAKKADAFFKSLEDFEKFPDDKQIVSHLRNNAQRFSINSNWSIPALPRTFESKIDLDDLERRYPVFKDFIGLMRLKPDDPMPEEARTKFWALMANPKNFKPQGV